MLICRCAWHPQYFGHLRWDRVVSWRGWRITFTDGICSRCLTRFRAQHRQSFERRPAASRVNAA